MVAVVVQAIRGSQWQSADWSHRNDALGSMFEYNLIPFPPTLKNRITAIFANIAETAPACVRGMEMRINNQQ
jgi:hypothetical protein